MTDLALAGFFAAWLGIFLTLFTFIFPRGSASPIFLLLASMFCYGIAAGTVLSSLILGGSA